jgi:hypothetical protein
MGRVNKSIEGVFVNLIGSHSTRPLYEQFIDHQSPDGDKDGEYGLADFINLYKSKVTEVKTSIHQLAVLEIIIMQMRSRLNFKDSVKLYFVKKKTGSTYIYARCPFYRNESEVNEVRALIDKAELHTESQDFDALSKLSGNQEFMEKVYDELIQWMDAEIDENIRNYKKVYQN